MIFNVRHLTTYDYSEPVLLSHHAAHLTPRDSGGQINRRESVCILPEPAVLEGNKRDYFGNPTTFFTIQGAHTSLEVEAEFTVETRPPPLLPQDGGPSWYNVRMDLAAGLAPMVEPALDYLFPSSLVPLLPEAEAYAMPSFPPGRPLIEAVLDLTARIHADFKFDPEATGVGTPVAHVFADRRGVCQDFAHVGIAALRAMGQAARYVSGYIRTLPPPGKERLVGADASHAWLSVFVPGWGWLDVDPTNNTRAHEDHIVVAWGRDYDDVSPLKGVVLGGGDHNVTVAVDVIPQQ